MTATATQQTENHLRHLIRIVGSEPTVKGSSITQRFAAPHAALEPPFDVVLEINGKDWKLSTISPAELAKVEFSLSDDDMQWVDFYREMIHAGRPLNAPVIDDDGRVLEGLHRLAASAITETGISAYRPA